MKTGPLCSDSPWFLNEWYLPGSLCNTYTTAASGSICLPSIRDIWPATLAVKCCLRTVLQSCTLDTCTRESKTSAFLHMYAGRLQETALAVTALAIFCLTNKFCWWIRTLFTMTSLAPELITLSEWSHVIIHTPWLHSNSYWQMQTLFTMTSRLYEPVLICLSDCRPVRAFLCYDLSCSCPHAALLVFL